MPAGEPVLRKVGMAGEGARSGGAPVVEEGRLPAEMLPGLVALFEELCEGTVAVDQDGRITWLSEKYRRLLDLPDDLPVLGRPVEEILPESQLRQVAATGQPILLDIMRFGTRQFVVTRLPLRDAAGEVTGALGFVLYDRMDRLKPLLSRFEALEAELEQTRRQLAAERRTRYGFSHFTGHCPAVQELKRQARRTAASASPVLLLGETGMGKELLAQAIHGASRRASRSFVAVNVAAVPEALLEAEFFGVAPGAFTGAERKPRDGKFKLADGGTLFLDEIGDMPLQLQAKLLRVLQEQEIEPLGSNRVTKVDVRVIAATSRDLPERVASGAFRADLYYRLNVLPLVIPPLRERLEDLAPLCEALLEDIAGRNGLDTPELAPGALDVLAAHDWPGNVRELRNVLERACLLSDSPVLTGADLARCLPAGVAPLARTASAIPLADLVARAEREAIAAALRAAGGKRAPAAKLLGISRSQLYEKLSALGLSGPADSMSAAADGPLPH